MKKTLCRKCFGADRSNLEDARDDVEKWVNESPDQITVVSISEHCDLWYITVWYYVSTNR